jgi:hypothetical protein
MSKGHARALLASLALAAGSAGAHPAPNSVVNIDFGLRSVRAELLIPASELAYGLAADGAETSAFDAGDPRVGPYLLRHFAATTPSGSPWTMTLESVRDRDISGHRYVVATIAMVPPVDDSPRRLVLVDDVVTHEVRNHYVLVLARSDYAGGLVSDRPEILGFLQHPRRKLAIDRGAVRPGRGFASAYALGVAHIATGTDHLLFLLALLLPAAVLARNGRWQVRRGARSTFGHLVAVVTAFTIGHSVALVGAAAFGWQPAARGVETVIALSVLAAAVHAWRPVFPGREGLVAAVFGLCHGLSFARALGGHLIDPVDAAGAILGFNLGIESVQLLIVAASIPLVIRLAPEGAGAAARQLLALLAGVAAAGWVVERAFGIPNPVSSVLDELTAAMTLGAGAVLLLAGSAWACVTAWRGRRLRVPGTGTTGTGRSKRPNRRKSRVVFPNWPDRISSLEGGGSDVSAGR